MRPIPLAAALLGLALAVPAAAQDTQRQITVTGSAEVEAVPDLATVTAGVETQAATAVEALAMNSVAMTAVFAALETAKIERRDAQTSQLNLNPVFDNAPDADQTRGPKVIGYQASSMVTVKVRAVASLGAVIDAVTKSGANRLYGVGFEVSDPQATLDHRAAEGGRGRARQGRALRQGGRRHPGQCAVAAGGRRRGRSGADVRQGRHGGSAAGRRRHRDAQRRCRGGLRHRVTAQATAFEVIEWALRQRPSPAPGRGRRSGPSGSSMPIESRTWLGLAPAASSCSGVSWRWVVEAEWMISERASPRLATWLKSSTEFTSLTQAS